MRFEEHKGELFRMLEEPVPLTDDAELPVLVRLIQDDTMLGKANKRNCHPDTLAQKIICSSSNLTDDGLFMDGNYTYCYEIIGTLVEEGSKDWALYQMIQGEKVTKGHLNHTYWHYDARPHLQCISEYICGTLQIMVSPEIWIKTADKDGWQLYKEPETDKIASLEAEIAQLKKDKLELNAQCFHKDETISVLKNRIAELEFDNRFIVEQMNKMVHIGTN